MPGLRGVIRSYNDETHMTHETTVTNRIVRNVANRSGTAPEDLPPLHEHIDTDAIAALEGDAQIVFRYDDYIIVVKQDGDVRVLSVAPEGVV